MGSRLIRRHYLLVSEVTVHRNVQRSDLDAGESVTVTGITPPIEVGVVGVCGGLPDGVV